MKTSFLVLNFFIPRLPLAVSLLLFRFGFVYNSGIQEFVI